ncbi:MAG: Ig-like domain-containing protein, partial [Deltaproteobacteria bacterium]|nr:Ig-like domain-containing protein [Deltaproteobacteria bacterium]
GILIGNLHETLKDVSNKVTVNINASISKSGSDGSVGAVVQFVRESKKVYAQTLVLIGVAGSASHLNECLDTGGAATTGCETSTEEGVKVATAGDVGFSTTTLPGSAASTSDTTAPTALSISPTGTETQEPTATVTITFSEAMDQTASAAAATLTFNPLVPATAAWSADGTTLTLTPSTELRLGRAHTVTIGTGAKDVAGNTLAAASTGSLTIREALKATLVSGTATNDVRTDGSLSLAVASNGTLHAAWVEESANDLYYGQCTGNCNVLTNWTFLAVDTGLVNNPNTAIGVDGNGAVHIVYGSARNGRYTRCTGTCAQATNWSTPITIVGTASISVAPAIVIGSDNALHVAVAGSSAASVYVYCPNTSGCSSASNWTTVTVDSNTSIGTHVGLALAGSTLMIAYEDTDRQQLLSAACSSSCTDRGNWSTGIIDTETNVGRQPVVRVDSTNRFHLIQKVVGTADDWRYGTCSAANDCTRSSNWVFLTVATTETIGSTPSLAFAIDNRNGLHVVAFNNSGDTNAGLLYWTCDSNCTAAVTNWQKQAIATGTAEGTTSAIAFGQRDKLQILYTATDGGTDTTGDLKIAY